MILTIYNSKVILIKCICHLGQFHLFYFCFFGRLYLRSLDLRFGTVLNSEVDLDKKRLGIGVMNGFIGGFAAIIYGSYQGHIGVI